MNDVRMWFRFEDECSIYSIQVYLPFIPRKGELIEHCTDGVGRVRYYRVEDVSYVTYPNGKCSDIEIKLLAEVEAKNE
ncbi:MAG: hypothetical protein CL489_10735 [Acidobacteria bacterium]|nr:hypothetical protein [Acidobacteriota bacterium]|tara:strand:+ start:331 stop:564 length:234 start_codon:yes stop_codon:yes gene_type:complete